MSEVVLDASALLALLNDEAGADVVAASLPGAVISAVNYCETITKLCNAGMPEDKIRLALESFNLMIIPFDEEQAYRAGLLHAITREAGIGLGDRACLSLGKIRKTTVLTADKAWQAFNREQKIRLIR